MRHILCVFFTLSPVSPMRNRAFHWIAIAGLTLACGGEKGVPLSSPSESLSSITGEEMLSHIKVLASDGYEGRAPGTPGEDSTVAYLERQFKGMGLKPGNPDGSYVQSVGLLGLTSKSTASIKAGSITIPMRFPDEFVAVSRHARPRTTVNNSELVFVGYGIVAPEYGWDDYKGMDVKGKTLVMLINDPQMMKGTTDTLDDGMFKGNAMTYYGRWTYKYEIASEKGAAAVLIIHETRPAGYPYSVVVGSWGRENFDIDPSDPNRVPGEGWISHEKGKVLRGAAKLSHDEV